MRRNIFNILLLVGSIYFFYQFNFGVAVVMLTILILRIQGKRIQNILTGGDTNDRYIESLEKNSKVYLEIEILVNEILNHPLVSQLFTKLQESGTIDKRLKKDNRIKELLKNYQKKYDNESNVETIKFNVRNGSLWKNGEIDNFDTMLHEIEIPYKYKDGEEVKAKSYLTPDIYFSLTIRLLIDNGQLKIQLGEYSKDQTPKFYKEDGLTVYQTYSTITSFPLIYFSYEHKIPEKFLNVSLYSTDAWKERYTEGLENNRFQDWRELHKDLVAYNYICATANDDGISYDKWNKKLKILNEKKDHLLEKEGFQNQTYESDYYNPREYNTIHYRNQYMNIYCVDLNEVNEKRKQYYLVDYFEETL